MITNIPVYLSIADEAFNNMQQLGILESIPGPDGQPGKIHKLDPDKRSFKQSLIAIAFYGIYLDALLYVVGTERLGKSAYKKINGQPYSTRLQAIGITDDEAISACQHFRDARNDLIHEKAFDISEIGGKPIYTGQRLANEGYAIVRRIASLLRELP